MVPYDKYRGDYSHHSRANPPGYPPPGLLDCLSELLFVQKIPMDEIMVTKDIYPEVAKQLNKNPRTISRSVERLVLCCWEEGNRAYLAKIIGRNLTTLREPREMLFYLSVYSHWNVPFFTAVQAQPSLLF